MNNLPKNVTVWGEREDVETFMRACDVLMFNSTWECNPLVIREAINYGMKIMTRNLPQYMGMFDEYITPIKSNNYEDIKNTLLELLNSNKTYEIDTKRDFKKELLDFYKEVNNVSKTLNNPITKSYNVNNHFVVNPFIEISGEEETNFEITFIDEGGNVIYQNNLAINSWVKLNREYYTKWTIRVKEDNNVIFSNILNLENRRVYISFGSKSLGDSLAWIPYCEEFRKKHNCELIVSTFLNDLFVYRPRVFQFQGRDPYGDDIYQTPIWIRPGALQRVNKQDTIIKDQYIQIVGHTQQQNIYVDGKSTGGKYYYIDALAQSQYLVEEEGEFKRDFIHLV
jgi:hypothetical protein